MPQRVHLKRRRFPSLNFLRRSAMGISTHLWPITLHGRPSTKLPIP